MSALGQIVVDALYENTYIGEDCTYTPSGGDAITVRGIFDKGIQTTVRDEHRDDVDNTDIEMKVRQSEIAADVVKRGDTITRNDITYTIREHIVLNDDELVLKLTEVSGG